MKVFVDTNVLLDVIAAREPFLADSARVWALAESKRIDGLVSALSFTTVFYIVRRVKSRATAQAALKAMHDLFTVAACDESVIQRALSSDFGDFEDAVQYHCATLAGAEFLVTRDVSHFSKATIPVLAPADVVALFMS